MKVSMIGSHKCKTKRNYGFFWIGLTTPGFRAQTKKAAFRCLISIFLPGLIYLFSNISSETLSLLRPFALRAAIIFRPLLVDILFLKPCLLRLLRLDGWNVRFMTVLFFEGAKVEIFLISPKPRQNFLKYSCGILLLIWNDSIYLPSGSRASKSERADKPC